MITPRALLVASLVSCAACGGGDDAPTPDAAGPRCDPGLPFGPAAPVPELNSAADDVSARLSEDELHVVLARRASLGFDLYLASRATTAEPFGAPALIATANSVSSDESPSLSPDGLTLVFESDRTTGAFRAYVSRRAALDAAFGTPAPITTLADGDRQPLLASATALYVTSSARAGAGGSDVWRTTLDAAGMTTDPVAVVGGVNTAAFEATPAITSDERAIYFTRTDGSAGAEVDVYGAARSTAADGFGVAAVVPGLGQPTIREIPTWVSADGCVLYLQSDFSGGQGGVDIYRAVRGS